MRRSWDEIHSPPDRGSESDARELHARLQCLGSLMNENEAPSGNASGHWNKASISMTVNHDGLTQRIHRGINYSSRLHSSPRLPLLAGPRSAQRSGRGLTLPHTPGPLTPIIWDPENPLKNQQQQKKECSLDLLFTPCQ